MIRVRKMGAGHTHSADPLLDRPVAEVVRRQKMVRESQLFQRPDHLRLRVMTLRHELPFPQI
jgi:hypothetical protein